MYLLVATSNPGKRTELSRLLSPLSVDLKLPEDWGLQIDVPEDCSSYAANARQKAFAYANAANVAALADDSGLEVDALSGAPGIRSARYASGGDQDRVTVLLDQMRDVQWPKRTARFRCCVVAATPAGDTCQAEGVCEGVIALRPAGTNGFGYDPVFYIPSFGLTLAQLSPQVKDRISHRGRAVRAILPELARLLAR
jgi:XTP/dITP diphosphohydrolase